MIVMKPSAVPDNSDFARATTGTYLGADGLIRTAGANVPRYVDGVMVMEAAATNLLLRSQQLDYTSSWTRAGGPAYIVNADTIVTAAPDGSSTADTVVMSASTTAGVFQTVTVAASTQYTVSWWAKRSTPGAVSHRIYDATNSADIVASTSYYASINATTWTRVSVTFTTPASCTSVRFYIVAGAAVGDAGAHIWGAQMEAGPVATSYIPTTTATAGRAADSYTAGYIASGGLVTWASGAYAINETGDGPLWVAATAYVVSDIVVRTTTHRVYLRLVAGTTATPPENDVVNWKDIGATQKYLAFDRATSSSSWTGGIYGLALSFFLGGATAISLIGMDGYTATVKITDGAGGAVLYSASKTFSDDRYNYAASGSALGLVDWHLFDLPSGYPNAVAHIVISTQPGYYGYATVREIYYGAGFEIGATQYGARVSITDYSRKETDAFGTVTLVRRPFSRRMSCDIEVPLAEFQKVFSLLADLRATVCQWVPEASGSFQPLMMQGWYRDFSIAVAYPTYLLCTLEVESLAVDTLIEG